MALRAEPKRSQREWEERLQRVAPPRPDAIVVDPIRSGGAYLVGVDGRSWLDATGQVASLVAGYAPDECVRLCFEPLDPEGARRAVASYVREATGMPHVAFASSGAEALELALVALATTTPRRRLVAFEGSFHGRTRTLRRATWALGARGDEGVTFVDPFAGADAVRDALGDDVLALLVEPVQCAGGERYLPDALLADLRALTREAGVALVLDEVQTGFGAGGEGIRWPEVPLHEPDAIAFGKRAQLGIAASTRPLAGLTPDPATLLRLHSLVTAADLPTESFDPKIRPRLEAFAAAHTMIEAPRLQGFAMAFELPDRARRDALLAMLRGRGVLALASSERTMRFRFHRAWTTRALDELFTALRAATKWLEAERDPAELPALHPSPRRETKVRMRVVQADEDPEAALDAIVALEARVYEPARRDPREKLALAFRDAGGVAVLAERETDDGWELLGVTLGAPLERVNVPGPAEDPERGQGTTLYVLATTVDPAGRGLGLGLRLKRALVQEAASLRRPDGTPRYHYVTGRMRAGTTAPMMTINRRLGAAVLRRIGGQYGGEGVAIYYRMPLRPPALDARALYAVDLLDAPPETFAQLGARGALFGPLVHHLRLQHSVTPAAARALEHLSALTPEHPAIGLTGSLSTAVDAAIEALAGDAPTRAVAVVEGSWCGDSTLFAAALSGVVALENVHVLPRAPDALRAALAALPPVAAIVVEPLSARTGASIAPEALRAMAEVAPLVTVESATAAHRATLSPERAFEALPAAARARIWSPAPRLGLVHADAALAPHLKAASGGASEMALIATHHALRTVREHARPEFEGLLHAALAPLRDMGLRLEGRGLYRVAPAVGAERAWSIANALGEPRFVRAHGDALVFAPPFDWDEERWNELAGQLDATMVAA